MKNSNDQIRTDSASEDREFARFAEQIAASSEHYENMRAHMMATFNEIRQNTADFSSAK